MKRFRTPATALGVGLALTLAACGGGGGEEASGGDGAAAVTDGAFALMGTDQLTWDVTEATADAGELTIELTCGDTVNHNVVIEGVDGDAVIAECNPGEAATGTVTLEAGTYTYYCDVPGHRATMEGTLTVS